MLLRLTILSAVLASGFACLSNTEVVADKNWWKTTAFYQIYPRSFKDSDGDGVGDLQGIKSKLDHVADMGAGALWISPIYPSPMADFGYDIANFTDIDPTFGDLNDFDELVARAKELKLKVILDFVPNHSSDKHPWFEKSVRREAPYTDYYIWRDGITLDETGAVGPPNNWISVFQGSAWEWNEERGQYYLHAFVKGQPDLNYRSPYLRKEMEDALTFWLERGVEGFRVDAINYLIENEELKDEPPSNRTDVPDGYYDSLLHIYSMNQEGTYEIVQSWRQLLDDYSERTNTDTKIMMTEAYASLDLVMKYYISGSNVPFNFGFIGNAKSGTTAEEFKTIIDGWNDNMPDNYVANWVVGNHDQRRVASRYGVQRADQMSILCSILPGIAVTYNGDEIGMVDTEISWDATVDPSACNTDEEHYDQYSRDPARTPFQWDNTTNAGFSDGSTTWLPVNPNYLTLNLEEQKATPHSHYHVYQAMTALRKLPILTRGSLEVEVLGNNVLAVERFVRGATPIIALINCGETAETVNLNALSADTRPAQLTVYTSSVASNIEPGTNVTRSSFEIPGSATVVITSQTLYEILNGTE